MTDEIPEYDYRERCLNHYGEECHVCGATENIIVHHKDGDRGNNKLDNLIPLCEDHHQKVHSRHPEVAELVRELGYEPTSPESTTSEVSEETWRRLNSRKRRAGETFDDVLQRLLDETED